MDSALKQRLVGAAVLVALAVIFLPMLVQGPAPDSGVADVPLTMPDAPAGEFETRDLPLVMPSATPEGGAVGMPQAGNDSGDAPGAEAAIIEEAPAAHAPVESEPATEPEANADVPEQEAALEPEAVPEPSPATRALPPATAGGDYAVSFGSFSTIAAADAVVGSLRQSQLPGFRETATVDGRTWYRVRIGPYATRAEAESARLRAAHVRDDVGAKVVVLDTKPAASTPSTPSAASKPAPAAADTGFAVQLGAFSKPTDAIALRDRSRAAGFSTFTELVRTDAGMLTRVRAGPVMTRDQAEALRARIKTKLEIDGVVRSHP